MRPKQRLSAPADLPAGEAAARRQAEDAALWQRVAQTVQPLALRRRRKKTAGLAALKAETAAKAFSASAGETAKTAWQTLPPGALPPPAAAEMPPKRAAKPGKPPLNAFETAAYKRLSRGALPIEARLDLHGLSQAQAHDALLYFIRSQQARGRRHVLIITGRGRSPGSEGVLQRQVPRWLAQVPFRRYVAALEEAARPHGGAGAFYARLRRNG